MAPRAEPTLTSDTKLLKGLRSSDRAERQGAERELFEFYEPRVRRVLSRIVGVGADLDDAVQETFVDVFRGLTKFEGRSQLGTWIYRVALRRGWKCSQREKAARERRVAVDSVAEPAVGPTSSEALEAREMARRLEAALLQLSFDQRSIIALSADEGLAPAEIAATLGVAVGTVHSRLSRARSRLRELLERPS